MIQPLVFIDDTFPDHCQSEQDACQHTVYEHHNDVDIWPAFDVRANKNRYDEFTDTGATVHDARHLTGDRKNFLQK